jgi:hypothetical protein
MIKEATVFLTDSARPLVALCESSAAMAHARRTGTAAAHGTAIHAYIERALAIGAEEALAELPEDAEHRPHCAQIDIARIPKGARVEAALRWNRISGKAQILGYSIGRNYPPRAPGDEDGTADLMALCEDADGTFAWVGDVKSGFRSTGPTAENQQLRALAMKAAKVLGVDRSRISTLVRQDGRKERDYHADLDSLDLAAIEAEHRALAPRLAKLRARYLAGERLPVVEGAHCQEMYCAAYVGCWAKQDLVAAGVAGQIVLGNGLPPVPLPTIVQMAMMAQTEEGRARLGAVYARSRELRAILHDQVEAAIKGIAAQIPNGLPLPDGKRLLEVEVADQSKIIATRVEAALRIALPEPAVSKVLAVAVTMEPQASLTSIKNGLRLVAERGRLAGMERAVREALRTAGAILEGTHMEVRPMVPRKLEGE